MSAPTEQLASDVRESTRRLTDAMNDLGRKVDSDRAELSALRREFAAFRTDIAISLESSRLRAKAASIVRWMFAIAFPVFIVLCGLTIWMAWRAWELDVILRRNDEARYAKAAPSRVVAEAERATGR